MPKRPKPSEATAVKHLDQLLKRQHPTTDDEAAECWNDAETLIDSYLEAVERKRLDSLPSATELGEACFWLLYVVGGIKDGAHTSLVTELLSPHAGVQMFQIASRVATLKTQALAELEAKAKAQQIKTAAINPSEEDLF